MLNSFRLWPLDRPYALLGASGAPLKGPKAASQTRCAACGAERKIACHCTISNRTTRAESPYVSLRRPHAPERCGSDGCRGRRRALRGAQSGRHGSSVLDLVPHSRTRQSPGIQYHSSLLPHGMGRISPRSVNSPHSAQMWGGAPRRARPGAMFAGGTPVIPSANRKQCVDMPPPKLSTLALRSCAHGSIRPGPICQSALRTPVADRVRGEAPGNVDVLIR